MYFGQFEAIARLIQEVLCWLQYFEDFVRTFKLREQLLGHHLLGVRQVMHLAYYILPHLVRLILRPLVKCLSLSLLRLLVVLPH